MVFVGTVWTANKLFFFCEPGVCTSLNKIVHFQAPIYFDKLRHIFLSSFFYCWMCRLWEIPPAHINQIFGTSERRHIPWMSGFLVWYFFSFKFSHGFAVKKPQNKVHLQIMHENDSHQPVCQERKLTCVLFLRFGECGIAHFIQDEFCEWKFFASVWWKHNFRTAIRKKSCKTEQDGPE